MSLRQKTVQQVPHRILIPTTQITILSHLNSNLKVYEISGAGSFSGVQTTQHFPNGITFTGTLTGRANIYWKADAVVGSRPLNEFLHNLRTLTTVADAVLDSVTFYERVIIHESGKTYHLQLQFEKGNVHPQIMRSLVTDGAIPLGETYEVLVDLKRNLMNLPPESRKHWKPGYLILTDIPGNRNFLYDVNLVWSILQQRFPSSILVSEAVKNWDLKDYQSILGLRRARPT